MLGAVEQPLRHPLFREGNLLRRLKDAVHSAAKMLHEDQGHASVLSEPAGSETNPGQVLRLLEIRERDAGLIG